MNLIHKKEIKISYHQILTKDNNTLEYVYPLNTEKFSAKNLEDVSINIEINSKNNIKNVYCISHKVDIKQDKKQQATINYSEKNVKPDKDFKLYFTTR